MSREFLTFLGEQNQLIKEVEDLKKGVEVTVFKAEEARDKGLKREQQTQVDDGKRQTESRRHKHHAEKKQTVKKR